MDIGENLPSRYLEAHAYPNAQSRGHLVPIVILDRIKGFYKIAVITGGCQYADVRRYVYLESGTGSHIQARPGLTAFCSDGPIYACPEIHKGRKALIQKEIMRAEV